MDTGGFVGALGDAGETVRKFNGYLFKDQTVIPLDADEIGLLIQSSEKKWNHVEPAIFGTLLESALDTKERAQLGAHFTPRAYVERLVMPTVIEPLRADWAGVQAAAASLIEDGKADEAKAVVEKFHGTLAQTKVLDPACGTGNFLYVALARMKELEGEVVSFLTELGDVDYVLGLSGHTITPENFLGIEINPRAAAIAQLVLWIGYLQWHFRVNGETRMPPEPVLRDVKTIENRDALICWDKKVLQKGVDGKTLTRWDGETMMLHPVTGKKVPDETARVEVYQYINPKAAKWPKADFIVGNPPFIGNKRMRQRLGDHYCAALRAAWQSVPNSVDLVMYWWEEAARLTRAGQLKAFGLISTNSIKQISNRVVIEKWLRAKPSLALKFAVPDHPWRDEATNAQVRVAMTVGAKAPVTGWLEHVTRETKAKDSPNEVELQGNAGVIHSNLTIGVDVTEATALAANEDMSFMGVIPSGVGFRLSEEDLQNLGLKSAELPAVVRCYLVGNELTDNKHPGYIVDYYGLDEEQAQAASPSIFQQVLNSVKSLRSAKSGDTADSQQYAKEWWLFAKPRPEMRKALAGLHRYIATTETSKYRWFTFLNSEILPDQKIRLVSSDDSFLLGVLSSRFHVCWADATGGRQGVGNDPVYNNTTCFAQFPFPAEVPEALKERIRTEAEKLDELRKQVLAAHDDLTLTDLYKILEVLRSGRGLTDAERDVHDRGLVTLIKRHHDNVDALVAEAYGWPDHLTDEEILVRLVALNKARAAEENKGLIRWLRPEFQAPKITDWLDTGAGAKPKKTSAAEIETFGSAKDKVIPWPKTLAEQVSAVSAILAAASAPLDARDIARTFDGKRAASVTPVLDALTAIGKARRLGDGRYAA